MGLLKVGDFVKAFFILFPKNIYNTDRCPGKIQILLTNVAEKI